MTEAEATRLLPSEANLVVLVLKIGPKGYAKIRGISSRMCADTNVRIELVVFSATFRLLVDMMAERTPSADDRSTFNGSMPMLGICKDDPERAFWTRLSAIEPPSTSVRSSIAKATGSPSNGCDDNESSDFLSLSPGIAGLSVVDDEADEDKPLLSPRDTFRSESMCALR